MRWPLELTPSHQVVSLGVLPHAFVPPGHLHLGRRRAPVGDPRLRRASRTPVAEGCGAKVVRSSFGSTGGSLRARRFVLGVTAVLSPRQSLNQHLGQGENNDNRCCPGQHSAQPRPTAVPATYRAHQTVSGPHLETIKPTVFASHPRSVPCAGGGLRQM